MFSESNKLLQSHILRDGWDVFLYGKLRVCTPPQIYPANCKKSDFNRLSGQLWTHCDCYRQGPICKQSRVMVSTVGLKVGGSRWVAKKRKEERKSNKRGIGT